MVSVGSQRLKLLITKRPDTFRWQVVMKTAVTKKILLNLEKSRPRECRVVLMRGAGVNPRRLWLSFQMPAELDKFTYARRAFWRSKPRRERVSLGLSAHLAAQSIPANVDLTCVHMTLREGYMARCVCVVSW